MQALPELPYTQTREVVEVVKMSKTVSFGQVIRHTLNGKHEWYQPIVMEWTGDIYRRKVFGPCETTTWAKGVIRDHLRHMKQIEATYSYGGK